MPVAFPAQASPAAVPVSAVSVPVSAVSAPVSAPVSAGSALRPFGSAAAGGNGWFMEGRSVEVCVSGNDGNRMTDIGLLQRNVEVKYVK